VYVYPRELGVSGRGASEDEQVKSSTVEDELVDLERVCEEGTAVKEQQPREDQPGSAEQADDQLAGAREVDHLERALTRPADDWLAVTDGQAERGVEHAQNRAHL
jgi:hypothetical protein